MDLERKRPRARFAAATALLALGFAPVALGQQGYTNDEVRIGVHLDLSGPINFWGVPMRNGHLMRIEEQNEKGGVHGRRIRLIIEDNAYDPKKGLLATQKLIQQDRVFALVGVLGTPVAMASMQTALEAGVPMLYPGSNAREMFEPYHKMKFSMSAPYDGQVRAGLKWLAGQKAVKRFGIIYQDDEFGKELRDAWVQQARALNIEVAAEASYKRGDTSFTSQVARMRQANVDLIGLGTVVRETVGVAGETKKLGWQVNMLTSAAACNGAVPNLGKDVVEGIYMVCQYVPFDYATETQAVKDWMDRYKKRFGTDADVSAAISYDMQEMVIQALQAAGRDLSMDRFLTGLEGIRNWQSTFGAPAQSFGPNQHLGTRAAVMTQITGGKFKRLTGTITE
jgi:ABC-type branched-subunit amino acid transport system substrate-binding protein